MAPGSLVAVASGGTCDSVGTRHRSVFTPGARARSVACALGLWATSPDNRLVEFVELDGHPFWIGTQAHPELKSRPTRPAPLFRELVGAALRYAEERAPHLFPVEQPLPASAAG